MGLTIEDALSKIGTPEYSGVDGLIKLVNETSAEIRNAAPNATTLLYSGAVDNSGTRSYQLIDTMKDNFVDASGIKQVVTLTDSAVTDLLKDDVFIQALKDAAAAEGKQFDLIMDGVDASGNRVSNTSLWDIVSKAFAESAVGDVRVIAPNTLDNSVFAQTELPALLANPNVTAIEGIPKTDLLKLGSHAAIFDFIKKTSFEHMAYTGLHYDKDATHAADDFLHKVTGTEDYLTQDPDGHKRFNKVWDTLSDDQKAAYKAFAEAMNDSPHGLSAGGKLLNKLGVVGGLLGFSIAYTEASSAAEKGDTEQAKEIMAQWATDETGSVIGEALGAALGGIAVSAAGAALSAPLAATIVIGGSLVGGFFGAEGITDLYGLLKDKDGNDRLDIIDRLSDLFFGNSTRLPVDLNGGNLTFIPAFNHDEIVQNAKTEIAWRYALQQLNPFAITDISYDQHNQDGSLDMYDPAIGQGVITEPWLIDRAQFIVLVAKASATIVPNMLLSWSYYEDIASGTTIGIPIGTDKYIFGGNGVDVIEGGVRADHLYGGSGNDTLTGNSGNDYLEGGQDTDTYLYNDGDGFDTIVDTDGLGQIKVGTSVLSLAGGKLTGPNEWLTADGKYRFTLLPNEGETTGDLHIQATGLAGITVNILVKNFQDGDLGIAFPAPVTVPTISPEIVGDLKPIDFDPATDVDQFQFDALGNLITDPDQPEPGREDILNDSAGNDHLQGMGGYDELHASEGGDDLLEGGDGSDSLYGTAGNDKLYADIVISGTALLQANADDVATGLRGDLLSGGADDDELYGANGNDFLSGGMGKDVMWGFAGDDLILGDDEATGADKWWYINREINLIGKCGNFKWIYTPHINFEEPGIGDDDIINGGSGDDWIFSGGGNDVITAGKDQDVVFGSAGNDTIYGQEGDDYIEGDDVAEDLAPSLHGDDILFGGQGKDVLSGHGGSDILDGGSGDDILWGDNNDLPDQYQGEDLLNGGEGNDILIGGGKTDTLLGGEGIDLLQGDDGDDYLYGGAGDDLSAVNGNTEGDGGLSGGAGNDKLYGETGRDALVGGDDDDYLDGGSENDLLSGEAGNDYLTGGSGDDYLDGGEGNDILVGGIGTDTLVGGLGDDIFKLEAWVNITINDNEGSNTLDLSSIVSTLDNATISNNGADIVITFSNGHGIMFDNGLFGAIANIRAGSGETKDLETWVGISANTNVTLQLGNYGEKAYGGAGDDLLLGGNGNDDLSGHNGTDILNGGVGNNTLNGGDGSDLLMGNGSGLGVSGNDILNGGAGNDSLYGEEGNDVLEGGEGNDLLQGGVGSDTYLFDQGWGQDIIQDSNHPDNSDNDIIQFGMGIGSGDIAIRRFGQDLILRKIGSTDTVTVQDYFAGGFDSLEFIRFADGTQWDKNTINSILITGTTGDDLIYGYDSSDTIDGLGGNDIINGRGGDDVLLGAEGNDRLNGGDNDDTLIGGAGRDLLFGGAGNDIYLLDSTSDTDEIADILGQNTIRFASNINLANLSAFTSDAGGGQALTLTVNGYEAATITVGWTNFNFQFADGTVLSADELLLNFRDGPQYVNGNDNVNSLYGGKGADTLYGWGDNDVLWGGAGNDQLVGGLGSDDYHYRLGDGHDAIIEEDVVDADQSSLDRVIFGSGISIDDVVFKHLENGDLSLTVAGIADAITVSGWYSHPGQQVESFIFADGQQVTAATLASLPVAPIIGTGGNDILVGTNQGNTIIAGNGDDLLIGNGGNDILYGGSGIDTYRLSPGSGSGQIFENEGETSVISVSGFDMAQLTGTRVGDDLRLGTRFSSETFTLKNYYTMNHTWQIKGQTGVAQDLSALLTANEGHMANRGELDALQEDFIASIHSASNQYFKSIGMELQADGTWLTPFQLTATQNTQVISPYPLYTGYVPPNTSYSYFSNSSFTVGKLNISTYSSNDMEITFSTANIVNEGVNPDGTSSLNLHVDWGNPVVESNSQLITQLTLNTRYLNEAELIEYMQSLGVSGIKIQNPYHYYYTYTPAYMQMSTQTSVSASLISITPADGNGYDPLGGNPSSFFQNGNFPDTISVTAYNLIDTISIINGGDGYNNIDVNGQYGIVHAGGGDDRITVYHGQNLLDGGSGNDEIFGGYSEDILIGGTGNDLLEGGSLNDRYYFTADQSGTDLIYDNGTGGGYGGTLYNNTVVFGKGVNLSDFTFSWGSEALPTYNWGSNYYGEPTTATLLFRTIDIHWKADSIVRIVLPRADEEGFANKTGIQFFEFADGTRISMAEMLGLAGISQEHTPLIDHLIQDQEALVGVPFSFVIPADAFADQDNGDVLHYSLDNTRYYPDWLNFDPETRTLSGTPGASDINSFDVTIKATDQFGASVTDTFTLSVNQINRIEGTAGDDYLVGTTGRDEIYGFSGCDFLDGGLQADNLIGGDGNDTFVVDDSEDIVIESIDEGIDTIQASVDYTLSDNVENLSLIGTLAIDGVGNALDNLLAGNNSANTLVGGLGDDTLNGGEGDDYLEGEDGNDLLDGAAGIDTLVGGTGDDTYVIDSLSDIITESANAGTDTVKADITYTLNTSFNANVENLTLTGISISNATGNNRNNVLTGNSAANTLTGGIGTDTMVGGAGNDIYIVDNTQDLVTEMVNEGTDLVKTRVSYGLSDNVENLIITGTSAINGTGNALNNTLTGNNAVNILTGGVGDDTYVVGAGDSVVEANNEGVDLVRSKVTFTLSANVENLTQTGTTAINGTGNALDNTLTGNSAANMLNGDAGNDRLVGGAGADTLVGGTGNDTFVVDVATDIVTENANEGTDTIETAITYTLGGNIENLTLTGTAARNGTGNVLDNRLIGNNAVNTLSGGLGNDLLTGGLGTDKFVFNTALNASTNKDTITDFSVVDDTIKLGKTIFTKFTAPKTISAGSFVSGAGAVALDSNDYLIYDTTNGSLYYDADGNGAGTQVEFVQLMGNPTLTAADFWVV